MKKIDVCFRGWGQDWLFGTLADDGVNLLFEYSAEALKRGVEFSPRHLPLRANAFSGFPEHMYRLPGLVADALPDGWGLLLMDRCFLKQGFDPARLSPLDRLHFLGDRAMGALAFEPRADLSASTGDLSLRELAQAAHQVIEDVDTAALKQLALLGGSPQGARPKVLVQFDQSAQTVSTQAQGVGLPWLIKFPGQHEHKEVCGIEYAYSRMARACGLDMPPTHYFDLGKGLAAFGVQRFDRECGMRVPVHTLAGALHTNFALPSMDYRTLLRATRLFTHDEVQVQRSFARCVFNVVFHNRDDHAKNFSWRMNEQLQYKLAPAYDLTFSSGPGGQHHTTVMGEGLAPARSDLLKLADDCGVKKAVALAAIDRTCDQASQLAALLAEQDIRSATRQAVVSAVNSNVRRCRVQGKS